MGMTHKGTLSWSMHSRNFLSCPLQFVTEIVPSSVISFVSVDMEIRWRSAYKGEKLSFACVQ